MGKDTTVPFQYAEAALAHAIAAESRAFAAPLRSRKGHEVKEEGEVAEFSRAALAVVLKNSSSAVDVQERISSAKEASATVLRNSSRGIYVLPPSELLPPTLSFSPSDAQVRRCGLLSF